MEIIKENLDSLEQVSKTQKKGTLSYLKTLLALENSRLQNNIVKFGKNLSEIKELSIKQKNPYGMAVFYYWSGIKAIDTNPHNAFLWFIKSADAFKKNKDTVGLVHSYLHLSTLNQTGYGQFIGNPKICLAYAQKAVFLAKKSKNILLESIAMGGISGYYYNSPKKDYKKIEKFEETRLKMLNSVAPFLKVKKMIVTITINLSAIYIGQKKYEEAYKILKAIRNLAETKGRKHELATFYDNLAEACLNTGRFHETNQMLQLALKYAKIHDDIYVLKSVFEHFKILYKIQKKYELALTYSDTVSVLQDSILTSVNSAKINELEIKYESQKKESLNKLLQSEKSYAESRQRLYLWGAFITSFILFIVIILSLNLKKSNNKLQLAFEEIEQLNKARERFFGIIAHDLRRPMHAFQGMNELVSYYLKSKRYTEIEILSKSIDEAGQKIQLMLDNLLKWALGQQEKVPYAPQNINLALQITNVINLFEHISLRSEVTFNVTCPKDLTVFVDINAIDLIIRNLLDNAIKSLKNHSGTVIIEGKYLENSQVLLTISDNGIGIKPEKLQLINNLLKNAEQYQAGENGLGLGLVLIAQFIKRNKCVINVDSKLGMGTVFSIYFPLGLS
jgi:signal transduction histidine kinase